MNWILPFLYDYFIYTLDKLWVCVVLNPNCSESEKLSWQTQLQSWASIDVCPLEDPDTRLTNLIPGKLLQCTNWIKVLLYL